VVVVVVADAVAVVVPSVATTIPTTIIVGPTTTQSGSKHDGQEVATSILHADYSFVEASFQECDDCDKIYAYMENRNGKSVRLPYVLTRTDVFIPVRREKCSNTL
jgi:hypothetical protein